MRCGVCLLFVWQAGIWICSTLFSPPFALNAICYYSTSLHTICHFGSILILTLFIISKAYLALRYRIVPSMYGENQDIIVSVRATVPATVDGLVCTHQSSYGSRLVRDKM